jgi:hypothetical protein
MPSARKPGSSGKRTGHPGKNASGEHPIAPFRVPNYAILVVKGNKPKPADSKTNSIAERQLRIEKTVDGQKL